MIIFETPEKTIKYGNNELFFCNGTTRSIALNNVQYVKIKAKILKKKESYHITVKEVDLLPPEPPYRLVMYGTLGTLILVFSCFIMLILYMDKVMEENNPIPSEWAYDHMSREEMIIA